jgi:predicted NAD/FAD-dependent oxidoreductase
MLTQDLNTPTLDAIVIGAGMAGLTIARRLADAGQSFVVLDKSRGVGGRVATRRDGEATNDHGAQFYRERAGTSTFDFADPGLVHNWFTQEGVRHQAARGGLSQIAKHLRAQIDQLTARPDSESRIVLDAHVEKITKDLGPQNTTPANFSVTCKDQRQWRARRIYLTAPLPQALQLLDASGISWPNELRSISYAKALVGLFEMHETDNDWLKDFKYKQDFSTEANPAVFSISNQQSKQVSRALALTVVMTPDFSEKHFDADEPATLERIREELLRALNGLAHAQGAKPLDGARIVRAQLKKWRYSHPLSIFSQPFLKLPDHEIYLCGDAFGGPSINGAVASGRAVPVE